MKSIKFGWDIHKSKINFEKHGITFEEAKTVFDDDGTIRIISARESTKNETKQYKEFLP